MLMPVTLRGHIVCLEPLTIDHVNDLCAAASEDRSTYTYTYVPNGQEDTKRYIEIALADFSKGRALPFVVRHLDTGLIVGTTRFLNLEVFSWPPGVASGLSSTDLTPPTVAEIGSTWYAASFQRTGVNTECKLLMLAHAFDSWNTIRVTLKTDARNIRSRSAIQRLGLLLKAFAGHTSLQVMVALGIQLIFQSLPKNKNGLRCVQISKIGFKKA